MGLLDWFSSRRKNTVSDALWQQVTTPFPFLNHLLPSEQNDLRKLVDRFLQEKEFTSAGGLELTDEICVSIAVQGWCHP